MFVLRFLSHPLPPPLSLSLDLHFSLLAVDEKLNPRKYRRRHNNNNNSSSSSSKHPNGRADNSTNTNNNDDDDDDDDDVVVADDTLPCRLRCPLTLMRIKIAAKGKDCTHVQCFDARSYVKVCEGVRVKVCVCVCVWEGVWESVCV